MTSAMKNIMGNTNIVTAYVTEKYVFYIRRLSLGMLNYCVYYVPMRRSITYAF